MTRRLIAWVLASCCAVTGALADETARYRVEIALNWDGSVQDGHPADKHWSRLIAFAHSSRYTLFADGDTASSGLALVATNGRVGVLEAELAEARRRGRVGAQLVVPGLDAGVGTFSVEVEVTDRFRFVSFATMLAPSPDWFSGASAVPLMDDAGWLASVTVPLWVWDAGADSGPAFMGPNADTQPRQSVRLLSHPAFLTPEGLAPIGTATFTRLP
ncbi:spondin domain-containing protein [uncultured Tateyamaria sp.]|uniref:spondin domain-containing protein n=1 Tax=Tateyamaria sp. 1078 TaxID=3417464 RepID=UPI00261D53E5|nr:spondin domain-containing protein [uncultured Tateyamaria sp.]